MEKIRKYFKKIFLSYRSLPGKKQYIEFFTALLTVPVLLTVIILNFNNLKGNKAKEEPKNEQKTIIITAPPSLDSKSEENTKIINTPKVCKQGIGPVSIDSPHENERITDNPVIVEINYDDSDYCSVVWAYKINDGKLSDYGSNNIALYNPPQGPIKLEVRVKSTTTRDEKVIKRLFFYDGPSSSQPPVASTGAN